MLVEIFVDGSGFIYAPAAGINVVEKWAPVDTGSTLVAGQFNTLGSGANQLNQPTSVFVDAASNVYVLDLNNFRVQKWAPGATQGVRWPVEMAGAAGLIK
jgi:hypothetical protein